MYLFLLNNKMMQAELCYSIEHLKTCIISCLMENINKSTSFYSKLICLVNSQYLEKIIFMYCDDVILIN